MGVDKTLVRLDRTAREQHGLVTSGQAVAILGPYRKAKWVTGGRLCLVQPGVLRLAAVPPSWHQSLMAAVLAAGGVVSHRSAAELWGLIPPTGYVEVSAHPDRRPRLQPPAIVHRAADLHPTLATRRHGLPITDPVRTLVDLRSVMPRALVDDAISRGLFTRLVTVSEAEHLRGSVSEPTPRSAARLRTAAG